MGIRIVGVSELINKIVIWRVLTQCVGDVCRRCGELVGAVGETIVNKI
jgi:hypothetical protein